MRSVSASFARRRVGIELRRSVVFSRGMRADPETEPDDDGPEKRSESRLCLRWALPDETRSHSLSKGIALIGRAEDCALVLEHPRISRHHARIVSEGRTFVLEDLNSTNGVFVNGERTTRGLLQAGTVVRIADWLAVVEAVDEGETAAPCTTLGDGLVGGAALRRVLRKLTQVAPSRLPVVLEGDTGTGKELFARAIHRSSGRSGPFHALNCATLAPALADAELFGHRKGAFTGADRNHAGHLVAAHEGTLFLDEIGDLGLPSQAKLLRAIETNEVIPVGETQVIPFDARVVAATQTPLAELVQRGTFRRDLAMRLSGLVLTLPALAQRRGDIPQLLHHFMFQFAGAPPPRISVKAYERLCLLDWKGNVRELRLLAQQLIAMFPDAEELGLSHLPDALIGGVSRDAATLPPDQPTSTDGDLERFALALRKTQGNVSAAAELAGISRTRVYRLLRGRNPAELLRDEG